MLAYGPKLLSVIGAVINKLTITVIAVVAIAAAVAYFVFNRLDSTIANMIETQGTLALGTPVKVNSVATDLGNGTATITGITVANAQGYKDSQAIEIPSFTAEVDYKTLAIRNINIDGAVVNAELVGGRNNFQDLLDNMPDSDEKAQVDDGASDRELSINRLGFINTGVKLSITQPELGERSFTMDDLVMTDLNGTADEISDEVSKRLVAHISRQIAGYARRELQDRAVEEVKDKIKEKFGDVLKRLGD